MSQSLQTKEKKRGFALVGVLFLVVFLGLLATTILDITKTDAEITHDTIVRAQASALADGGIYWAIHDLLTPSTSPMMAIDGTPKTYDIKGAKVEVRIQDEDGKIDLNWAPLEVIESLLTVTGFPQAQKEALMAGIRAKRQGDDASNTNRSSRQFLQLDEIRRFADIDDHLYSKLEQSLSVYSQKPAVQPALAPKDVLLSLPSMTAQQVDEILARRAQQPVRLRDLALIENSNAASITAGRTFSIQATVVIGDVRFTRLSTVRITGSDVVPYGILQWTENLGSHQDEDK